MTPLHNPMARKNPPEILPLEPKNMPSDTRCFKVRFCSTPEDVRRALALIMGKISTAGADQDFCGRTEIVLAEVLNNVVEHALSDKPSLMIETCGERCEDGWHFLVSDPGCPLPGEILPQTQLPAVETELAELPEGGFGWAMVHLLARDVEYTRLPHSNQLSFDIPFAQTGPI